MKNHKVAIVLSLGVFFALTSKVLACAPGFPSYFYTPYQIQNSYYPLIGGYKSTDSSRVPFLNNNYEVIGPKWGPEYMFPVYMTSIGKDLPKEIKDELAKYNEVSLPTHYMPGDFDRIYSQWTEPITNDISEWASASAKIIGNKVSFGEYEEIRDQYGNSNCNLPAFVKASETLKDRQTKFTPEQLKIWTENQNIVFKQCRGQLVHELPVNSHYKKPSFISEIVSWVSNLFGGKTSAPITSEALLQYDTEYQFAATKFYQGFFDEAVTLFTKIANNKNNPWRESAALSLGRTYIRNANYSYENDLKDKRTDAEKRYTETLNKAKNYLEKIISDSTLSGIKSDAEKYLDYVLYRTDPEKRLERASLAMESLSNGDHFRINLEDYVPLIYKSVYDEKQNEISDKLQKNGSGYSKFLISWWFPERVNISDSIKNYKESNSPIWLLLALRQAKYGDSNSEYLIQESGKISNNSPFYLSARYYTLLLESQTKDEPKIIAIKAELESLINQTTKVGQPSAANLFTGLRFALASDNAEKQQFALLKVVGEQSYDFSQLSRTPFEVSPMTQNVDKMVKKEVGGYLLNPDYAKTLNNTSTTDLTKLMSGSKLEIKNLIQINLAIFTRAVITDNLDAAQITAVQLNSEDPTLASDLRNFVEAKDAVAKKYYAVLFLLKYPALDATFTSETYDEFSFQTVLGTKTFDSFRRNYSYQDSCPKLTSWDIKQGKKPLPEVDLTKLTGIEKEKAIIDRLIPVNFLSETVLNYANLNPAEKTIPEALHYIVNAVKLAGCSDENTSKNAKKAFQLLHNNYSGNYWTKQTPVWFEN